MLAVAPSNILTWNRQYKDRNNHLVHQNTWHCSGIGGLGNHCSLYCNYLLRSQAYIHTWRQEQEWDPVIEVAWLVLKRAARYTNQEMAEAMNITVFPNSIIHYLVHIHALHLVLNLFFSQTPLFPSLTWVHQGRLYIWHYAGRDWALGNIHSPAVHNMSLWKKYRDKAEA